MGTVDPTSEALGAALSNPHVAWQGQGCSEQRILRQFAEGPQVKIVYAFRCSPSVSEAGSHFFSDARQNLPPSNVQIIEGIN